jgi:hypothetical protein
MSIEKITAFPEITDVVIEDNNIVSLTQGYYDIDKVTVHIQKCIEMVRKYEKMGYYNLAKPEFISAITEPLTFSPSSVALMPAIFAE